MDGRSLATLTICTSILFAQQIVLQGIPNIELVSILIIVYTLAFRRKVLYIIYVFVLLQGLYYGFSLWWWLPYLYVWTILAFITWLFRSCRSPLIWAVISGIFGLSFGALCSIPHLIIGGPAFALSYWISGIPFSIVHCIGNFVICLVLWRPLIKIFAKFPGTYISLD